MKAYKLLPIISVFFLIAACDSKKFEYNPYDLEDTIKKKQVKTTAFEVDFKKTDYNTKTIHIKLNDANGYDALFDTGCSSMLISSLELAELIKSGTITKNDYMGDSKSIIADGTIIKHPMYKIREIKVVDKKGQSHSVRDIIATVVDNQGADVLIGSAVIDNLAKKSYTIDLEKKVIRFE